MIEQGRFTVERQSLPVAPWITQFTCTRCLSVIIVTNNLELVGRVIILRRVNETNPQISLSRVFEVVPHLCTLDGVNKRLQLLVSVPDLDANLTGPPQAVEQHHVSGVSDHHYGILVTLVLQCSDVEHALRKKVDCSTGV